uniref:Phi-1-like phosphate-induced protein n=1 Tax=Araucaria cunninghamii TaxID=56994 RepID=A0A0D6QTD2_ARACU
MSSNILLLVVVITILQLCAAAFGVGQTTRKLAELVEEQPLLLTYHKGPLLSTTPIDVHLIWYGKFSPVQRSIVGDYLQSLGANLRGKAQQPSAFTWWKIIESYKTAANKPGTGIARLGKQKLDESYSLGKLLKRKNITALVESAVKSRALPLPGKATNAVYLVLTSEDVAVERFCVSSCGFHASISPSHLPYAWVGNPASQCPGQCAWPFHQPIYGPQTPPLVPPNGDVGIDGMIINIATVLAGAVTNPFNTGYFQGDARAPLEAVTACAGIYGKGAYPGFPGELLVDNTTGASYNAHGLRGRRFLLPAMWDPNTKSCKTLV